MRRLLIIAAALGLLAPWGEVWAQSTLEGVIVDNSRAKRCAELVRAGTDPVTALWSEGACTKRSWLFGDDDASPTTADDSSAPAEPATSEPQRDTR